MDPPRCLKDTRKDILSEITSWTNDFGTSNVLWIHAYPGAGKSTIAYTIADQLRRSHRLGVIFAFDRKSVTSPSVLWRMISYKLACEYPTCRDDIISKLKSGILDNATATDIFRQLVLEPLQRCSGSPMDIPQGRLPVIVIDALDECGGLSNWNSQSRRDVLSHIAEWAKLPREFKLIVTSRFEEDIRSALSAIDPKQLIIPTGNAVDDHSNKDIRQYIDHRFANMAGRPSAPEDWPGKDVAEDLTRRACGIFIWAATALNYI
ncbi:hypothetical protein OBBRIDRAFT_742613, partial [Obba rivulosa]